MLVEPKNALAHIKYSLRVTEFLPLKRDIFFLQNVVSASLHKQLSILAIKGTNSPPERGKDYFKLKTLE